MVYKIYYFFISIAFCFSSEGKAVNFHSSDYAGFILQRLTKLQYFYEYTIIQGDPYCPLSKNAVTAFP